MADPKETFEVFEPLANDWREAIRDLVTQINEQHLRIAEAFSEAFIYGGIYVSNNAVATTISAANTEVQFTEFTSNFPSKGMTPDYVQSHVTILIAGDYFVMCSLTVESGAGAAFTGDFKIKKNSGAVALAGVHAHRDFAGGGGDVGSISVSGLVTLARGDTIELWIENDTNTADMTVEDVTLNIVKVSENA